MAQPTEFYIRFAENGILIEYELKLDLGLFLQENDDREILFEGLSINKKPIYHRGTNIEFFDMEGIKKYMVRNFTQNEESASDLARNILNSKELFLTNGFKIMFSSELTNLITDWFKEKFMVVYRADAMEIHKKISDSKTTLYILKQQLMKSLRFLV